MNVGESGEQNSRDESGEPPVHDGPLSREQADELFARMYDALHRSAVQLFAAERKDHTLQPTALLHEAYLLMTEREDFRSREMLVSSVTATMRRLLIDHARRRGRYKRGGGAVRVPLEGLVDHRPTIIDLVEFSDALDELSAVNERLAAIVELRFFAGMRSNEVADMLELSERSVARHWRFARAWLYRRLIGIDLGGGG